MAIEYRLHPKFLRIEVSTGIACRVWKVVEFAGFDFCLFYSRKEKTSLLESRLR